MNGQEDNDKTRVQSRRSELEIDDKTRFSAPKKPAPESVAKTDVDAALTQIKPKATQTGTPPQDAAADRTRVQKSRVTQPTAAVPEDVTRIASVETIATGHSDKTRLATIPPVNSTVDKPIESAIDIAERQGALKNRFVFEEILGTGGMGMVYKAKDLLKVEAQDRDPYVAIKVLSDEFKAHPEAFIALQRESRKTQRIAHPNIVNVHDFDRDGDTVFMTMEYMEGKPLDKLISQYRSLGLPPDECHKILEGISAALTYAHKQHIIHSDFKPGNIFVSDNGTAKVFDFGIARAVAKAENREESIDDKTVFDAGNLGALTPAYASLEMLEGSVPDVRDDVYALGCIAYELYSGQHPFNRVHADEAYRQKLKPKRIPGLNRNQWKAIEGALSLKRQSRIETVDEFWQKFIEKPGHLLAITAVVLVALVLAAGAVYKYLPELFMGPNNGDVRSEIEQELRLEMRKQSVADLISSASFTEDWESQLWSDIQTLRDTLGEADVWLKESEATISNLYITEITRLLKVHEIQTAQRLISNASRYVTDIEKLKALEIALQSAIEKQKQLEQDRQSQQRAAQQKRQQKEQQQQAIAQIDTEFDRALATVKDQLNCRNHINMSDFEIALTKLKSLSSTHYGSEEANIMGLVAQCISGIGEYFPDRAEVAKQEALRIFAGNRVIERIRIAPKDTCNTSLAGLGASGMRATCRDILKSGGRGPVLVVAPAAGNTKAFAIGKYELTREEYNDYCNESGKCTASTADPHLPVTGISLADARSYVKWLGNESGKVYRLPTFGEWQHAARAKNNIVDPNRNCKLRSRGISRGNALLRASVGQQNAWGLVNYLGNAREWAIDRGGIILAVGGAYETEMNDCNITTKTTHSGAADKLTGFRVVREIGAR